MKKILISALITSLAIGFGAIVPASAQTHDQICLANRTQCLKGCDGMAQCSSACQINYERCLQGGQLQSSHFLVANAASAECQQRPLGNEMSAGPRQAHADRSASIRSLAGNH